MATINTNSSGGSINGSTTVASNATITGFSILSGGVATISGVDSASTIFAGGAETIVNGGSMASDVVYGAVTVSSGGVQGATVQSGGVITLYGSGAADSGSTILAGGLEYVSSGATASNDQIYGTLTVSTTPSSVTSETVYAGGVIQLGGKVTASATTIEGGTVILESKSAGLAGSVTFVGTGGVISATTAAASGAGDQAVISGFTVGDEIIATGSGNAIVVVSGTASIPTLVEVTSGGSVLETYSFATDALVSYQGVYAGNAETITVAPTTTVAANLSGGTVLAGMTVLVQSGATLSADSVLSGGTALVYGADTGATIALGGTETVIGTAGGDIVLGTEIVTGTLAGAAVAGGLLELDAGASLTGGITFTAGGTLLETALLTGSQVISGFTGADTIALTALGSGATLTSASVGADAVITIAGGANMGGAVETFTLVGDAGSLVSLGAVSGGDVLSIVNPVITVSAGQNDTGDVAASGYKLNVLAGGTETDAQILSGATALISGADAGSTIAAGGAETVAATGTATGDQVYGTQIVSGGVSGESIFTGGMIVLSGASSASNIVLSGGVLSAASGTLTGGVTFAGEGGTFVTTAQLSNSAVISGFSGSDVIDLASIGTHAVITGAETIDGDMVITISGGSSMGSASEVLTFAETGVIFQLGADAAGTGETLTAIPLITSFTAGDIVFSAVGDVDNSADYGDNQAAPIALEEIDPTTGKIVGEMILPQETSVNASGTIENIVSGEYGSSSEGILQLSENGEQLVIAGYGVNADVYNTAEEAGGVNNYGTAALAQTTSLTDGTLTPVPRVIADISYDGTIDSSTAVYNIYNTNNPRSVITVDGKSFYLSGQGAKDGTQGVFYVTDGSTAATAIDTATDTRDIEIYNGTLYVSQNSSEGTSNIESFGTLPTTATTPSILSGIDLAVTLTSAEANSLNSGEVGTVVNLSPEQYFFANATTLYVADSGNPKAGTIGDGGLQKWVLDTATGKWSLAYTLSAGLNLVENSSVSSDTAGTTGLIGLTGMLNADGTVTFYATNSTLGDLNQTYVYTITDTVSATVASSSETFSVVTTAQADTNDRGISLAPESTSDTTIASGVTSAGLHVGYGSEVTVLAGGTLSAAVVSAGGAASVYGADAGSLIVLGGSETIYGTATGDNIYGDQIVSGSVANETIYDDGAVTIATGGTATDMTLQTGAELIDEGSASGVVISGGLVVLAADAATLSGVTFAGIGELAVLDGAGTVSGAITGFAAGDVLDITGIGAGATLTSTTAGGNTILTVSNGGVTESFTLAGAYAANDIALSPDAAGGVQVSIGLSLATGTEEVTAGEYGAAITVASGAALLVDAGATVTENVIATGGAATIAGITSDDMIAGALTLASGAVASNETLNGGTLDIAASVSLNGLTVSGDSTIVLESGATLATPINGFEYGDEIVLNGIGAGASLTSGTASGNEVLTITSGATVETVTLAGTAYPTNDFSLSNGTLSAQYGSAVVSGGQVSANITADAHITLDVLSGGTAVSASVLSGGTANVVGADVDAVISSGGTLILSSGGAERGVTILAGGTETLIGPNIASGDQVYGLQQVLNANSATGTTLSNETIFNGGTVDLFYKTNTLEDSTILSGGVFAISGNATGTDLTIAGGTIILESPKANLTGTLDFAGAGTLLETAVISAGYGVSAVISGFGVGDAIELSAIGTGATLTTSTVSGLTVETISASKGSESFTFAATSDFTLQTLSGGGYELLAETTSFVSSGAVQSAASVTSGTELVVTSGGTLSGTTVALGGTLVVAGGSESGGTVSGGTEVVSSGGLASNTSITGGGTQYVTNGGTVAGATVTDNSTQILTSGAVAYNVMVGDPSVQVVSAGASASGTVLTAGGEQDVYGTATSTTIDNGGEQIIYTGGTSTDVLVNAGGTLALDGGMASGVTLTSGALVDVGTLAFDAADTATIVGGVLEIENGTSTLFSLALSGDYAGAAVSVSADAGSGTDLTLTLCFYPGTRIATPAGEVVVEDLRAGDLVMTAEGAKPVRWIGESHVHMRFADHLRSLPVRIKAGALGDGLPARDLLLSPDHALFLDGVLVQAGALVGLPGISRERDVPEQFTYYHVELASHELLSAEGALAESFVDNVERRHFANWDEREADPAPIVELPYPRAKSARQLPRALAARLAAQAVA